MSDSFVDSFRAGPSWPCPKDVYKHVWHIQLLSVQWINSWWWTDELSETCRVSWQYKFVKLVHLVGFIIKKHLGSLLLLFWITLYDGRLRRPPGYSKFIIHFQHGSNLTVGKSRQKGQNSNRYFISLLLPVRNVLTSSGAHPASCSVSNGGSFPDYFTNMTVKHNKFVKPNYGMPLCKFRWTTCFGHSYDHHQVRKS
jgi:hypothetical protein